MKTIYKNLPDILCCCISDVNVSLVNNSRIEKVSPTGVYVRDKSNIVVGLTASVIREFFCDRM